jgi:two-component system, LytTR family, response regulator
MTIFRNIFKSRLLHTIIIDDEVLMRQTLKKLVHEHCRNVRLVAEVGSVKTGVEAIQKYHPDLVLLDIKLEDGTGFDLLKKLEPIDFKVIFITAYDEFAIKAIKFSALDYLLKPVEPEDLKQAVDKAEKLVLKEMNTQLGVLADNMQQGSVASKKIILKTFDNVHLVRMGDIIYCESDDNYTTFHLIDKSRIIMSNTLKEYEDMLGDYGFFRVHKSYLVNLAHITRFEKAEGGNVILTNNAMVPVSFRKRELLLEMLDRIGEHLGHRA